MVDYVAVASAAADKLLIYSQDQSGWRLCKKTDDVSVCWRPSSEFPGNIYKGEGIIQASPDHVWQCLNPEPGGLRTKWDKNVQNFEVIEAIADSTKQLHVNVEVDSRQYEADDLLGPEGAHVNKPVSVATKGSELIKDIAECISLQNCNTISCHEDYFSKRFCGRGFG